jgi:hypothetical protein
MCTALTLLLLALACSPSLTVNDDFDPDIEFDRYYTWYWLADTPTIEAVEGADKSVRDIDDLVRSLIDAEMSKKGLTTVETNPDIWVNYHIGMKGEFGGANFDRDYLQQIQNAEVYKSSGGVIIIDVIDARTGRLAWRGTGTGAVNVDPTPEMVKNNLTRAIKKIMDKFPPK